MLDDPDMPFAVLWAVCSPIAPPLHPEQPSWRSTVLAYVAGKMFGNSYEYVSIVLQTCSCYCVKHFVAEIPYGAASQNSEQ
jgi:hypothetical protein